MAEDVVIPPVVPPVVPPVAQAWYSTLDPTLQKYVTDRGLVDKDPVAAFQNAAQAHQAAQGLIGAPADRIVKLPGTDEPDAWKAIWQRLGAPADPTGYDFSAIKPTDAAAVAEFEATAERVRSLAVANNLPVKAAQELAAFIYKDRQAGIDAQAAAQVEYVAKAKADLKVAWGQNYDANIQLANNAARALNIGVEELNALEKIQGYGKTMELLRTISTKIGEDTFVTNTGGTGGGLHTPASAGTRIQELMADQDFAKRYLNGGSTERKEMDDLHAIAANQKRP